MLPDYLRQSKIHVGRKKQSSVQPRSQDLSSYRPQERTRRDGLSSLAPGGGKVRDPGNEVVFSQVIMPTPKNHHTRTKTTNSMVQWKTERQNSTRVATKKAVRMKLLWKEKAI